MTIILNPLLFPKGNNQKSQSIQKQQHQQQTNKPNSNYLLNSRDLCDLSPSNYDQSFLLKKQYFHQHQQEQKDQNQQQHQAQQQQNRLLQIENEIQNTYAFYVKNLNERRDYLLKEFHNIVQFVISQNQKNKQKYQLRQLQKNQSGANDENQSDSDYKLDSESLSDNAKSNDLQALINNYLMSIEFVTNLPAIQNSIYNTFGHIRYNSNTSNINANANSSSESNSFGQAQESNNNFYKPKPIGTSSASSPSYNSNSGETLASSYNSNNGQFLSQSHGN